MQEKIYEIYKSVIKSLCTDEPDDELINVPPHELPDGAYIDLQTWCVNHANNSHYTGDGIIRTAWYAAENMNW